MPSTPAELKPSLTDELAVWPSGVQSERRVFVCDRDSLRTWIEPASAVVNAGNRCGRWVEARGKIIVAVRGSDGDQSLLGRDLTSL